jgi:hypothetical protein
MSSAGLCTICDRGRFSRETMKHFCYIMQAKNEHHNQLQRHLTRRDEWLVLCRVQGVVDKTGEGFRRLPPLQTVGLNSARKRDR